LLYNEVTLTGDRGRRNNVHIEKFEKAAKRDMYREHSIGIRGASSSIIRLLRIIMGYCFIQNAEYPGRQLLLRIFGIYKFSSFSLDLNEINIYRNLQSTTIVGLDSENVRHWPETFDNGAKFLEGR
jgi:hypothetical protein